MSDSKKITDRLTELANQAVEAAGPVLEKGKATAGELADKATPYVEKAAGYAAHGVSAAAEQIDKATKGKYSDKITSVSSKIEHKLDRDKGSETPAEPPLSTPPAPLSTPQPPLSTPPSTPPEPPA